MILFHRKLTVCRRKWMFLCVLGENRVLSHLSIQPANVSSSYMRLVVPVYSLCCFVGSGLVDTRDFFKSGCFVTYISRSTYFQKPLNICTFVLLELLLIREPNQTAIAWCSLRERERDYLAFWSVCPYYQCTSLLLSIPCYHPSFCMSLLHTVFYYLISITQFLHHFSCTI